MSCKNCFGYGQNVQRQSGGGYPAPGPMAAMTPMSYMQQPAMSQMGYAPQPAMSQMGYAPQPGMLPVTAFPMSATPAAARTMATTPGAARPAVTAAPMNQSMMQPAYARQATASAPNANVAPAMALPRYMAQPVPTATPPTPAMAQPRPMTPAMPAMTPSAPAAAQPRYMPQPTPAAAQPSYLPQPTPAAAQPRYMPQPTPAAAQPRYMPQPTPAAAQPRYMPQPTPAATQPRYMPQPTPAATQPRPAAQPAPAAMPPRPMPLAAPAATQPRPATPATNVNTAPARPQSAHSGMYNSMVMYAELSHTPYTMTFDTALPTSGMTFSPGKLTAGSAGVYEIGYEMLVTPSVSANITATLLMNGEPIAVSKETLRAAIGRTVNFNHHTYATLPAGAQLTLQLTADTPVKVEIPMIQVTAMKMV